MAASALLNIRNNHTFLLYQGQSRAWTVAAPWVASQVSLVGKGAKKREVPKALWGALNACWLVIRSLAAYNYAKLQRWVGVVSSGLQGQRTYFSLGLSLSVRLHRHRDLRSYM